MLTIALLSAALALAPPKDFNFAPNLDQSAALPDMSLENAQKALDTAPIIASARSEFSNLGPVRMTGGNGPWVVRAGYQSVEQLNLLRSRAAPWRVYPAEKILIIEVNNLYAYDQLIGDGFTVQIDAQRTASFNAPVERTSAQINSIPGFTCYRTVEETYATAETLVVLKPQIAEWLDIGDSRLKQLGLGGYDIRALHISNRSIPGPKPVLMIQSAIHAREYATAESVTRFAEQLVNGYGTDPDITWMVDYHDINLVLVANPDGRKVAETSATRLQRKNRNPLYCSTSTTTVGVDLNRNYPFDYAGPGTSTNVCGDTFRGPGALSEAESIALTTFENSIFPDQRAETSLVPPDQTTPVSLDATGVYIDLHANGAGTWFPWGNTTSGAAPNATQLQTIARKIAFLNGLPAARSSDFGAIGGATDDWSFGTLGVVAFTIELGGNDFFPPCSTYESSIGPPAVASFFMAARTVRAPYRLPAGPDVLGLTATASATGVTLTASANDARYLPATEPTQAITSVALYNSVPWAAGATPIASFAATDGIFNSNIEAITLNVSDAQLPLVANTLFYAQATDAAGNKGPISAVFLSPGGTIFRDGFE
jgi:carboxypeptidase T